MKKFLLSLIFAILVSALLISFAACNSGETEDPTSAPTDAVVLDPTDAPDDEPLDDSDDESLPSPTEKPTEEPTDAPVSIRSRVYNISDDWKKFKYIGRVIDAEDSVYCDFTASGIEFEGMMEGNVSVILSCDRDTYFTVFIDGECVEERFYATNTTEELVIASFEEAGEHNIRFLKQTEAQSSLCVLKEVKIRGELYAAPANREYLIEFIGDSITCGYGNLAGPSTQNAGTALWEDGTQTYAFLAAEELGADATIIGCSGIGIDKGWTSFSEMDFYPVSSYFRDKNETYYNNSRVPNVVVINLGTNDQSRGSTEAEFKAGVRELIEHVRDFYGKDVVIVWAYNMMGNGCFNWTKTVLEEMGGEAAGLYSISLIWNSQGGGGHPDLETHVQSAQMLAKFIRDKGLLAE